MIHLTESEVLLILAALRSYAAGYDCEQEVIDSIAILEEALDDRE